MSFQIGDIVTHNMFGGTWKVTFVYSLIDESTILHLCHINGARDRLGNISPGALMYARPSSCNKYAKITTCPFI